MVVNHGVLQKRLFKKLLYFNTLCQNMTLLTNPIRLQWMASVTKKKTKDNINDRFDSTIEKWDLLVKTML
jgi:hypothetical protein